VSTHRTWGLPNTSTRSANCYTATLHNITFSYPVHKSSDCDPPSIVRATPDPTYPLDHNNQPSLDAKPDLHDHTFSQARRYANYMEGINARVFYVSAISSTKSYSLNEWSKRETDKREIHCQLIQPSLFRICYKPNLCFLGIFMRNLSLSHHLAI
jgi:hypothetical protein